MVMVMMVMRVLMMVMMMGHVGRFYTLVALRLASRSGSTIDTIKIIPRNGILVALMQHRSAIDDTVIVTIMPILGAREALGAHARRRGIAPNRKWSCRGCTSPDTTTEPGEHATKFILNRRISSWAYQSWLSSLDSLW